LNPLFISLKQNHIRHLPQNQQYDNKNVTLDTADKQTMKDEDYMQIALMEADRAFSEDEAPVGAVLVMEGRIIAQCHNAPITLNDPSAHAEMLAIREASRKTGNYRLTGGELFVTLEPCVMCAGGILQARLARVVFGARDPKGGAVVSLYELLNDKRMNHQVKVVEGVLQSECGEILSRFFKQKRVKADSVLG
jgi:tRNA(adenine34) deaminase